MMRTAAKAKRSAPHRRGSRFDHGGIHCFDRDGRLFASVPFHVALRRHPSPLAYVLRRHLRAPCARSVCDPEVTSRGTVGYADRSARCVSPPYALSPFVPRSVTRRGMGKFLLIYGAKRCRKYVSFQGLDLSKIATIVESASKSPINGAIFSEFFYKFRRKVTTCRKCVLSVRGAKNKGRSDCFRCALRRLFSRRLSERARAAKLCLDDLPQGRTGQAPRRRTPARPCAP